jgi:1,4-alpha-glucan branching enzyme
MIESLGAGWVRFTFDQFVESEVYLVGDFNGWDERSHLMTRQDDGTHMSMLKLNPGEYEFKYKSGCTWFNDTAAHKYVPNCWGSENSVVVVESNGTRDEVPAELAEEETEEKTLRQARSTLQPGA